MEAMGQMEACEAEREAEREMAMATVKAGWAPGIGVRRGVSAISVRSYWTR